MRLWIGAGAVLALTGCLVVPTTREVYDPGCKLMRREMTLETAIVGNIRSCGGNECAAALVATGVVTAASAVVSGSIAVVGNVVYWLERQGRCKRAEEASAAASTATVFGAPSGPAAAGVAATPAAAASAAQ